MSQNAQQALVELRGLITGTKEGPQKPLVPGESAFDLPSLAIDSAEETFFHLSAIFGCGPLQGISPASRNDGGADAKGLAAQGMIGLGIVSRIAQDLIPSGVPGSLVHHRSKLRRVLRRPPTDKSARQQMALTMTGNGQLWPRPPAKTFASAPDVVTADMPSF